MVDLRRGMKILRWGLVTVAILLASCSWFRKPSQEPVVSSSRDDYRGDLHWNLEFTWLKGGEVTHIKTYQFDTRLECFNKMYQMQEEAKKVKNESGAGLCYKAFLDGQQRTTADTLTGAGVKK